MDSPAAARRINMNASARAYDRPGARYSLMSASLLRRTLFLLLLLFVLEFFCSHRKVYDPGNNKRMTGCWTNAICFAGRIGSSRR